MTSRPDQDATTPALPRSVAELWAHWRELPPTLSPDAVLEAGWLNLSRSPLYRAIARGELPVVELGRRKLILTVPLLKMLGVDLDRPAVNQTACQACSHEASPLDGHDAAGPGEP
jgi:hypothetical protein